MVEFEGDTVTPSEATLRALRQIGFDWAEVSATDYWLRREVHAADAHKDATNPSVVDGEFEHITVARSAADDSPVVFIRNRKI